MEKHKIYKINNYAHANEEFIKNNYEEYSTKQMIKHLKTTNNNYHFRIKTNTQYVFFGDIDNYPNDINILIELFKTFFKNKYDLIIETKDFKYTKNDKKLGSYHYSIPKYNLSTENLKEFHLAFIREYKNETVLNGKNCIDTSIYSNHWFRCPLQCKGASYKKDEILNGVHEIINGKMKHFIVDYIPDYSIDINNIIDSNKQTNNNTNNKLIIKPKLDNKTDNKTDNKNKNNNESEEIIECNRLNDKEHIESLLNMLGEHRVNTYQDWINVGLILFNSQDKNSNCFDLWNNWSKKSSKYKSGECLDIWVKWATKNTNINKKLTLGTLHHYAKTDDIDLYMEFKKENCFCKLISDNYNHLALENNNVPLTNFQINNHVMQIDVASNYCGVSGENHVQPQNYIQLLGNVGKMYLNCRDRKCKNKEEHSCDVDRQTLNKLFENNNVNININNNFNNNNSFNNYGTINNNNKEEMDNNEYINEIYDIFDDKELNIYISKSLSNTPYDIALLIWYLNKDKYICINKKWYYFNDNIWTTNHIELRIKYIISVELPKYYEKIINYFKKQSEKNKIDCTKKINNTIKLINSIKTSQFKNNILGEAEEIFWYDYIDFEKNFNMKTELIGFTNGVYDLENMEFRKGKKEDYITMTVGYDYVETPSKHYNNLIQFLEEIQPNKEERDYLLTFLSLPLFGENTQELIHIFSGVGRNGKSKLADLLSITFGSYFETISASLLTKEQPSANVARPDLLVLKDKRLIIASEPEANQKLNASFVKLITGNDKITARTLYNENIMTFMPNFSLILLCNDVPKYDKNDEAIWKRSRCVEFPTKFTNNPIGPNEKLVDLNLKHKLKKWKEDFMLVLLSYYKKFKITNQLKPTLSILKFTNETKDDSDIYKQYIDERIEESTDNYIHSTVLYNDFKIWFRNNYKNIELPSNKKFFKHIKDHSLIDNNFTMFNALRINDKVSSGFKNISLKNE